MRTVRLFVSSPGDVDNERRRVERVAARLNGEFAGVARIETIRWETAFYSAHANFQSQIPEAANCDLVLAILWSRLGSELPPEFPRMPDGEPYPSGTAYEVLTAIWARETKELPDIFVFKKTERPRFAIDDAVELERARTQWGRLQAFFERWFVTPQGHFRAAFQTFESTDEFEGRVEALLRDWIETHVLHGRSVVWPIGIKGSPFCGLAPFDEEHAPVFFGRARDVARAIDRLKAAAERKAPFLLVVGASGAGKSSLVRAGLVARLTAAGVVPGIDIWRVALMRPGSSPIDALAQALFARVGEATIDACAALPELADGDYRTPAELAALLRTGDATAVRPIVRALDRVGADEQEGGGFERLVRADLLLVVDQLDDLFATDVAAENRAAFGKILCALAANGRVWIVATLRAALYEPFLAEGDLKALKDAGADYDLAPPGPSELAEIVRKPADAAALVYEHDAAGESLDERLLRDAAGPDTLPLLQFTLQRLFEARQVVGAETRLTHAAYAALGGIDGAIEQAAERALSGLREAEVVGLARLLRQLAVPVQDAAPGSAGRSALTIRAAPLAEAAPDAAAGRLVAALVEARILLATEEGGVPTIRLAHQRVLDSWQRARDVVAGNADFFRIRGEVEEQRRRWEASGRKAELLLPRGLPLAEGEQVLATYGSELGEEMRGFIAVSGRRARLRQRLTAAAAAVFALVAASASILGLLAYRAEQLAYRAEQRETRERVRAEEQTKEALLTQSRFLADLANQHVSVGDAATAMLLALEALPDARGGVARPYAPEAEAALFAAEVRRQEGLHLRGHEGEVASAAFSPDGARVVTTSSDKTARVWDAATGKTITVFSGHADTVRSGAFSPDGTRIVTASLDKTARIWDLATGGTLKVLRGHNEGVLSAAFSPDGARMVTASWDKTARIWDVASGNTIMVLVGHGRDVMSASFSPDGNRVVTASRDNTARVWDAATGTTIATLVGHTGHANSVLRAAFSPDGTRVVTAAEDNTARIWDATTGQTLMVLTGHEQLVWSAAFSADGSRVITASWDKTARIWNAATGKTVKILTGHEERVLSAAFSPDDTRVVTASLDKTARIWEVATGRYVMFLAGHENQSSLSADQLLSAAFSPDGTRVVTVAYDKTARIWDASAGKVLIVLNANGDFLSRATFSPDGIRVIAASGKTAHIWDAGTGKTVMVLTGHADGVLSAAFSADGTRVVTGSHDKTARIWDTATGKTVMVLTGHADGVLSAAFSPNGSRVITASFDKTARIWDAATGQTLATLAGHTHIVRSAVFSPDGARVVTASDDKTARIWDIAVGNALMLLAGHEDWVSSAAFSANGARVVTASRDQTARIWDAVIGKELIVLRGHDHHVASAAFNHDGTRVVTASADTTARIWRLFPTTQHLVDHAKQVAPRCLTLAQRKKSFLDPEPPAWCVEMEKSPYHTAVWKEWLKYKKSNTNPPLPDTPEWQPWIAAR